MVPHGFILNGSEATDNIKDFPRRDFSRRDLSRRDFPLGFFPDGIFSDVFVLYETGLYGSPWVHIERIRSHGCYKGSDIPNRDLVCYIILNLGLDVGRGNIF